MNPSPFLVGLHGSAVGVGIASSIHAVAGHPDGPESWVHFCLTAADEAHAAVLDDPPPLPKVERDSLAETVGFLRRLGTTDAQPPDDAPAYLEGAKLEAMAHEAAAAAFRLCMPNLTGRRNAQGFLACIAAGTQRRYFTGPEAKSMLYTAQIALSAYPSRRAIARRKR